MEKFSLSENLLADAYIKSIICYYPRPPQLTYSININFEMLLTCLNTGASLIDIEASVVDNLEHLIINIPLPLPGSSVFLERDPLAMGSGSLGGGATNSDWPSPMAGGATGLSWCSLKKSISFWSAVGEVGSDESMWSWGKTRIVE